MANNYQGHWSKDEHYEGGSHRQQWRKHGRLVHNRGRGRYRNNGDEEANESGTPDRQSHRPPPGLKGREIGMWYAKNSKKKEQVTTRK